MVRNPFPSHPGARPPRRSAAALAVLLLCVLVLPAAPAGGEGPGRWLWPIGPPHVLVRPFEAPPHRYGPGHRGIDVSAPEGTVRAVEAGTVRFAGSVAGRPVLSILHADGLISTYEPVTALVAEGDAVTAGQVVGQLWDGEPHCASGPCLHLGARRGQDYLDPLLLLGARGPSVLLPLAGGTAPAAGAGPATASSGDVGAAPLPARDDRAGTAGSTGASCAPRRPCAIAL